MDETATHAPVVNAGPSRRRDPVGARLVKFLGVFGKTACCRVTLDEAGITCSAWTDCERRAGEPESTNWTAENYVTVRSGWAYSGKSTTEVYLWSSRFDGIYLVDHDTQLC